MSWQEDGLLGISSYFDLLRASYHKLKHGVGIYQKQPAADHTTIHAPPPSPSDPADKDHPPKPSPG
eukprot:scaffold161017_cov34-Prasinocladus_malaysianus.AAC.1